ncbi:hypothetical protein SynBIOSE41_02327 [Synechococcus sp. BIOS-E4-1]|nr:hypothetical protein SynBIOSE41_02327 [Synechococcus sp. BIOS-E4-1]
MLTALNHANYLRLLYGNSQAIEKLLSRGWDCPVQLVGQ